MKKQTRTTWTAVVLLALSSLTPAAHADATLGDTAADTSGRLPANHQANELAAERVAQATAQAAAGAAERVIAASKLDLDIRLLGTTLLVSDL